MYCPRCGQQQISDQTKFCSRCGFQMSLVSELLLNNGFLPQLAELYNKRSGWLTRKNGLMFSLFCFLFFLFIMTPFWGIVDVDELSGISAILGIFGGLMLMIASLVFLKKPTPTPNFAYEQMMQAQAASLYGANVNQVALPPQQTQPATAYTAPHGAWRTPDTGEFAVPGSVTDSTTKLLNKDE